MSENRIRSRRRRPCPGVIGLLTASLASACSPPGVSSPTPVPSFVRFQLSGRVLDQLGAPVPGAVVQVEWSSSAESSVTRTNDAGEYAVEYVSRPRPGFAVGHVHAHHEGHEVDVQWVPVGPSPAVRDLNLRATRPILAGESTLVTVGPGSSLCTDLEDLYVMQSRCEIVVIESGAGTLDVEARPVSGGAAPSMFWYTRGNYAGLISRPAPGAVSIPVRGGTYRVLVGLPEGSAPQQFNITTSLR